MDLENWKSVVSLGDLPDEDVVFKYIFSKLEIRTLFTLGDTCTMYRRMVHKYFEKLKVIDIGVSGAKIDELALSRLLESNRCCLKLVLRNCKSALNDRILEPMLEQNKQLLHIDVTNCISLTNNSLQVLATSCTRLKYVCLRDCVWTTPEAVTNIGVHCNNLEFLDLSGCWNINDEAISTISITCPK